MTFIAKVLMLVLSAAVVTAAQTDSTGIKLIEQRKYQEAQSFFETAVKKNKKDAESRYYLAMTLMVQSKTDEAEDEIDEAIDLNENVARYHLMRGNILGQKAMKANVISQGFLAPKIKNAYLRASELDPENVEARIALFNYYLIAPGIMGGSEEKAFEQATAVQRLQPFRGHLLLSGYYLRAKKDTARAEKELRSAIAADPSRGAGYKQLGYFLMNAKRYQEAYSQMSAYIEREPSNPDAYDSYADVLKAEGKYERAIDQYRKALALDKNFSASIFAIAECFELTGQKQKAKETYQWFLSVEPNGRRSETATKKIKEL